MTTLLALSSRQPGASPPVESTLRHILAVVKASASLIEAQGNATWLSTLCEFDGLGNTSAQFVALNRELDQGLDELQLHWAFEAHYSAAERAEEERALREDMQANRAVMLEVLVSLSEISGEQHGIKSLVEVGREASISPRRRRVPFSVRWFASFFSLEEGRSGTAPHASLLSSLSPLLPRTSLWPRTGATGAKRRLSSSSAATSRRCWSCNPSREGGRRRRSSSSSSIALRGPLWSAPTRSPPRHPPSSRG